MIAFSIRPGNGNCLLHAVLIAMAGIHDFNLHLRDRLLQFMVDYESELKTSWRIEQSKFNRKYGIQSQESQLNRVRRRISVTLCTGMARSSRSGTSYAISYGTKRPKMDKFRRD